MFAWLSEKSRADPSSWIKEGRRDDAEQSTTEETDSVESGSTSTVSERKVLGTMCSCADPRLAQDCRSGFVGIWRRIEDSPRKNL